MVRDVAHRQRVLGIVVVVACALALSACEGRLNSGDAADADAGGGGGGRDAGGGGGGPDGGLVDAGGPRGCGVQEMYAALEPTCGTCHRVGKTPYFASGASFYNLLVRDPTWVTPGDPGASRLVAILEGTAPEPYPQMPLGVRSFAQLAADGETEVGVDEVRAFITALDGCDAQAPPPSPRPVVQRKSARQIHNTLKLHLGLVDDDIVRRDSGGSGNEDRFPIWSPDTVERLTSNVNIDPFNIGAARRWYALGGESYLKGSRANDVLSPTFGQTMVQVSQAWCRVAVEKPDNAALFRHVTQGQLDAATPAQIKDNISYLMLRFWGHVATPEEVDATHDAVYATYAASQGAATAWVATCAALIRDPMWLSY